MKLHKIAGRLRAVSDALRRVPNRDLDEHSLELTQLADALVRSLEGRRAELRSAPTRVMVDGRAIEVATVLKGRLRSEPADL